MIPTQVEVEIITQRPTVDREEVERVESRLREFARRVNSGETSFAVLARLIRKTERAHGGGTRSEWSRQWVPEFANVAFALTDPKKVSKNRAHGIWLPHHATQSKSRRQSQCTPHSAQT